MPDPTDAPTPERPADMTDRQICDWIVETCLTFGAATHTAYKVAGLFIEGVREKRP